MALFFLYLNFIRRDDKFFFVLASTGERALGEDNVILHAPVVWKIYARKRLLNIYILKKDEEIIIKGEIQIKFVIYGHVH